MTLPAQKAFPVSWDQFHRDARALAWRLADAGPFDAIVAITRGGLVPAAISTGIGSQVQKPLAIVVVGGSLLAPVLILLVLPVLIDLFSRRRQAIEEAAPSPAPAE